MNTIEHLESMIRVQTAWLKKCARHHIKREKQILEKLKAEYEQAKKDQKKKPETGANTLSND